MVALAPHLVRPLPLVVPAFEGAHPDRLVGVGLNLYDVMSRAQRAAAAARRAPQEASRGRAWSPERHRVISGEEVHRAAAGAGGARADQRLPVLRLPDRRRAPGADRARRGRALRRGLRQPPRRHRTARARRSRARRARARRRERRALRRARRERRQRDRRVGRPAAPARAARRGRAAAHPAQPRHARDDPPRGPAARRRRDRAGRRRALDLRAAVARAHARRHDRQRLRGSARAHQAVRRGHRLPAGGGQRVLRHRARARASSPARSPACAR